MEIFLHDQQFFHQLRHGIGQLKQRRYDIERQLLSLALADRNVLSWAIQAFDATDFGLPLHGQIFAALGKSLHDPEPLSVDRLKWRVGIADSDVADMDANYLHALIACSSKFGPQALIPELQELALRDRQFDICLKSAEVAVSTEIDTSTNGLIEAAEQSLYDLYPKPMLASLDVLLRYAGDNFLPDWFVRAAEVSCANVRSHVPDPTDGKLIAVRAATQGAGNAFAISWAYQLATTTAAPIGIISPSQPATDTAELLLLNSIAGASAETLPSLLAAREATAGLPIEIDDSRPLSMSALRQKVRYLRRRSGTGIIVVNSLSAIIAAESQQSGDEQESSAALVQQIRRLAEETGVSFIVLEGNSSEAASLFDTNIHVSATKDAIKVCVETAHGSETFTTGLVA